LTLGLLNLKPWTHDRGHEVELGPVEIDHALRVDEDPDAVLLEDLVVLARRAVGPLEEVAEAGAAAAADAHAQRRLRLASLHGLLLDLAGRGSR
jgi:hypothetical protein